MVKDWEPGGTIDRLRARVAELERERAIVADYLRDIDADFRSRRPSERDVLNALLAPAPTHSEPVTASDSGVVIDFSAARGSAPAPGPAEPAHICQIARATSGASDCGLEPCEDAAVHRDLGRSRAATVRRVEPAPCKTCGHPESRHLREVGGGARWCDVNKCECVEYAKGGGA
jgi:hypothetical protein